MARVAAFGELTSIITMVSPLPAFISCHKNPEEKFKMLSGISFNFLVANFLLQSTFLAYIIKARLDDIFVINVLTTGTAMIFIVLFISTKMAVERPLKEGVVFCLSIPYMHFVFSDMIDEESTGLLATTFNVFIYLVLLDKVKAILE